MTSPMRKGEAVQRAVWLGATAVVASATLARRHPVAALAILGAATATGAAAFTPRNPALGRAV